MPTDGIKNTTRTLRRVQPLIGVQQLRDQYLHGLVSADDQGVEISDLTLQVYIDNAVALLETYLDISIVPRQEYEEKDYFGNQWWDWGYLQLNNIPVISVSAFQVTYLRDENGVPETVLNIPISWIRLREHDGLIRLVPNNAIPAGLQIDSGGYFFPEIFRRFSNVPQLLSLTYQSGFADGKVPLLVNAAIGLIAAIFALNNAADLILGPGIASQSLSIDGLSQAISSTSSAENHNNSAKVKEYYKLLFGDSINSPNRGIIRTLYDYWQGQSMNIL